MIMQAFLLTLGNFLSFLKHNLLRHISFALISVIILFIIWLKYIDVYTMNSRYLEVPDFTDYHISKLDSLTTSYNLRYIIIDSIFDSDKKKGVVVNQDPRPLSEVKKNRKIYLTINSLQNRKIIFPDIYDLTLRQAVRIMNNTGLKVGRLEYVPNLARNKVLDFSVNGISIKKGQEVFENTVIDLVIGKGLTGEDVVIPNLIGLNRMEANIVVKSTSLNIGLEFFNESVNDTQRAIVYKQVPTSGLDRKTSLGSSIDIFYSNNENQEK